MHNDTDFTFANIPDLSIITRVANEQNDRVADMQRKAVLLRYLTTTDDYELCWLDSDLGNLRKISPNLYYTLLPACLHTEFTIKLGYKEDEIGWTKHIIIKHNHFDNSYDISHARSRFHLSFRILDDMTDGFYRE